LTFTLVALVVAGLGVYFAAGRVLSSEAARARIERELTARLGQPVRIGSVSAAVFPDIAIDLRDVTIGAPDALTLGRVKVLTGLRALFADTIDIREVAVTSGRPGGSAPGFSFDLDASVLGDRLDVTSLTVTTASTKIVGKGRLTSIANLEGAFEIRSDVLDLSELIAIGAALAPPDRAGSGRAAAPRASAMHMVVKTTAPVVRFGAHQFRDLSTTIDAVPTRFVLEDLSLGLFGGTLEGRLTADTQGAAPVLRLVGALTKVNVADLLEQSGSAGGITGLLNARVTVAATGADGASLMRSAAGSMEGRVHEGSMPHLDLVRTIVLAFGKPSTGASSGSGTAFTAIAGTFTLARGVVRSENFRFLAPDFDATGRGSLVIDTGAVDARADVILSRELTAQAGTDLRRYAQADGRVIVPATVSGTLAKPFVLIDVAAAAQRALGNELKRRATDFLGGLFKKKKGGGG
jgi:uncharacterized protein involved in outer membrane biogenesis